MKSKVFKWLYGLFCFVPALAVTSVCAYVALNENAKDSFASSNMISQMTTLTSNSQVNSGDTLYVSYNYIAEYTGSAAFTYNSLSFSPSDVGLSDEIPYTSFNINNYYLCFDFRDANGTLYRSDNNVWGSTIKDFYVNVSAVSNVNFTYGSVKIQKVTYYPFTLDGTFYYATHEVENNGFFSWVKGNFLYDGMNDFCGIFNAQNTFVSFYLTYVLTISLCYLAFEVLMLFINMARNLINSLQSKEW